MPFEKGNKKGKAGLKGKTGYHTVMTEEVIEKLKNAFAMGLTDEEASLFVSISPRTLYDYCRKHEDFRELKETLKHKPKIKAKMNILEKINDRDVETSKWYLERKSRDEFSLKSEIDNNINGVIKITFDM